MTKRLLLMATSALLAALVMLSGCYPPEGSQATMPVAQGDQAATNREVMHRFVDLFMAGQWDDFDQVIATDAVLHYPGGVDVVGLDAMKAGWKVFYGALSDVKATPVAEVSEGDLLMEFYVMEGNYTGDYMGQQVSGLPVKYDQVEMVRVEDGKIAEWWVQMDRLGMSEQLGFELQPK